MRTRTCGYHGIRNVSFSENFSNLPNEWSQREHCQKWVSMYLECVFSNGFRLDHNWMYRSISFSGCSDDWFTCYFGCMFNIWTPVKWNDWKNAQNGSWRRIDWSSWCHKIRKIIGKSRLSSFAKEISKGTRCGIVIEFSKLFVVRLPVIFASREDGAVKEKN